MNDQLGSVIDTRIKDSLILTLPTDLLPETSDQAQQAIQVAMQERLVTSVIFECSALRLLDTHEFQALRAVASLVSMMGAKSYWVGLKPEIVKYLVLANVDVSGIHAFLGLNEALDHLEKAKYFEFK